MKKSITIQDRKIRFIQRNNREILPICEDLLPLVGLENLCTETGIVNFFNLMNEDTQAAVKYACYECDLKQDIARERIKKYFLIDLGIRMTLSNNTEFVSLNFQVTSYFLKELDNTEYTVWNVLDMIENEGFEV